MLNCTKLNIFLYRRIETIKYKLGYENKLENYTEKGENKN
jgi:hypothetical protein